MARSLMLSVAVAACALLVATDFADAGCRHRRRGGCGGGYSHGGGCGGGYSHGCGGGYVNSGCGGYSGGCGGYSSGGCGGYSGCAGGGCQQAVPYDGQPIPDGGSAPPPPPGNGGGSPPPPPSASIAPQGNVVVSAPVYRPTYTNVTYRRGLFGRVR